MSAQKTQPDWKEEARRTGVPTFPIRIEWGGTKWGKRPLTENGHLSATTDVDRLNWTRANGIGIPMGKASRLYTLDTDDYKPGCQAGDWLSRWGLPPTRVHRTVSGGHHLLYRLPENFLELPSRINIVPGLDARGEGGWIAYGEGYSVVENRRAAQLPPQVCEELLEGWRGSSGPVDIPEPAPVDALALVLRLENALVFNTSLAKRFQRYPEGLTDLSRSGHDMSCAGILARDGWAYEEILWVLEHKFPHGTAKGAGPAKKDLDRELRRCAAKAIAGLNKVDVPHDPFFGGV